MRARLTAFSMSAPRREAGMLRTVLTPRAASSSTLFGVAHRRSVRESASSSGAGLRAGMRVSPWTVPGRSSTSPEGTASESRTTTALRRRGAAAAGSNGS